MPIPDDEKLEEYLKKFQPLAAEPLPATERLSTTRRWSVLGAWAAAAAIVVVAAVLILHPRPQPRQSLDGIQRVTRVEPLPKPQPLTLGTANMLLARAPSAKAAVDGVAAQAFQFQSIPLSEGTQSALAVLGKEKTKL